MNRLAMTLLVLGIVAGCSQAPDKIDTSGGHPSLGTAAPMTAEAKDAEVDTGRLQVFSPRTPERKPLDAEAAPLTYSGYTVYTEDGHQVAHENNHGVRMEGPVERKLAPGRYYVRLDEKVSERSFWVTIKRGQVTRVENDRWSEPSATVK
jgi:hypothetical protein